MRKSLLVTFAVSSIFTFTTTATPTLTALYGFRADENGDITTRSWDTLGGNVYWNLFLTGGDLNGSFLNGPNDAQADIGFALTDGVHEFAFFANDGSVSDYHGMNFFIDGSHINPAISVFAATDVSNAGPDPVFLANGGTTPLLNVQGQSVPGAGTLIYVDGLTTVSLTSWRWADSGLENMDRVGMDSVGADGSPDYTGSFTLTVVTVPEPSAIALSLIGFLAMSRRRR